MTIRELMDIQLRLTHGSYVHNYFFGQDHTANTTGAKEFLWQLMVMEIL